MRKTSKIITALALAGLAVAGGAAFTATGVAKGTQAATSQFLGGAVDQSVTGAILDSIVYTHSPSGTTVTGITLNFNAAVAENAHVSAIATLDNASTPSVAFTTPTGTGHNLVYTATASGQSLAGLNNLAVTVTDADAVTSTTFQNPAS